MKKSINKLSDYPKNIKTYFKEDNMKIDINKNTLVCGDNIEWLKDIPDNSIDMCYIDPPFFSNKNYEIIWGNGAEVTSFGDRFFGGIKHYIEWMKGRVELIHSKLKDTGSIFLHCDHHASHRLRVMLDDIFGEENYKNEIIWSYGQRMMGRSNFFDQKHDNILFYSKSKNNIFNTIRESYTLDEIRSWRGTKTDNIGEYYLENGGKGKPRYKRYIQDIKDKGKAISDVWPINILGSNEKERLGYPTQKPIKLIERIIKCSTNEGDIVLDCFGGGGTTANACINLNRKFISGDVSPVAIRIMADRLYINCKDVKFEIKNLPQTVEDFKSINGHIFADMVCDIMGWKVNPKKSNDRGIDGWDGNKNPIQIKNQKTSTGRPEMQKFHSAILSEGKTYGLFVAWSFARNAVEYVAELKEQGITIEIRKCENIFGPLILQEERSKELQELYEERYPKS
ncbi:MAG: hypothetical protein DRI84_06365 [Bacteroidetes bacterium]|nr:MAG: hypothetical protein DRI84_06365 [Bacteroidota bacterium]